MVSVPVIDRGESVSPAHPENTTEFAGQYIERFFLMKQHLLPDCKGSEAQVYFVCSKPRPGAGSLLKGNLASVCFP